MMAYPLLTALSRRGHNCTPITCKPFLGLAKICTVLEKELNELILAVLAGF